MGPSEEKEREVAFEDLSIHAALRRLPRSEAQAKTVRKKVAGIIRGNGGFKAVAAAISEESGDEITANQLSLACSGMRDLTIEQAYALFRRHSGEIDQRQAVSMVAYRKINGALRSIRGSKSDIKFDAGRVGAQAKTHARRTPKVKKTQAAKPAAKKQAKKPTKKRVTKKLQNPLRQHQSKFKRRLINCFNLALNILEVWRDLPLRWTFPLKS